jgi:immune inhibitor A
MRKRLLTLLLVVLSVVALLIFLAALLPASASPPAPKTAERVGQGEEIQPRPAAKLFKPKDEPNPIDYQRLREREKLLLAGKEAEAAALAKTGKDELLVILVEFAGTDVATWNPGDEWDPIGDPAAVDYEDYGDCSSIITETTAFTYAGPLHNQVPRPPSKADPAYDTVWREDFSRDHYYEMLFGDGAYITYNTEAGEPVTIDLRGYSLRQYFEEQSKGVYTVDGEVVGWVQVPHSEAWYGADLCPGARSAGYSPISDGWFMNGTGGSPHTLVKDAVDAVNVAYPDFDWARYDQSGDGVLDRVMIVHAGYGEEDITTLIWRPTTTGERIGEHAIWSHSSSVYPAYTVDVGPDGVSGTEDDIKIGPYVMMPENGGTSVFAHEFAHNLGTIDLYAYTYGEPSPGQWSLMQDDWGGGWPAGTVPPGLDPWHKYLLGWVDPVVFDLTSPEAEVVLGQASNPPAGTEDSLLFSLPPQVSQLQTAHSGEYMWWGGKENLVDRKLRRAVDLSGVITATLDFWTWYDIEEGWDFGFVQVSTDGGQTWTSLENPDTTYEHNPDAIGYVVENLPGFTGTSDGWVQETFDLSPYAGQQILLQFRYATDTYTLYLGWFVDDITITADGEEIFFDDVEEGPGDWVTDPPGGWTIEDGIFYFPHYYIAEWRNDDGFDHGLATGRYGVKDWGMLLWYRNFKYTSNEILDPIQDPPGFGPKGACLLVDSHFDPVPLRDPASVYSHNARGNANSRGTALRDVAFGLRATQPFKVTSARWGNPAIVYPSLPAVSEFHDSLGYYPGLEYTNIRASNDPRGPRYAWTTEQWDASAAIPAYEEYGVAPPEYDRSGVLIWFADLSGWYGYWDFPAGTGNPGEKAYGVNIVVEEEADDLSWGKVRVYSDKSTFLSWMKVDKESAKPGDILTYVVHLKDSASTSTLASVEIPIPEGTTYVPNSVTGGGQYVEEFPTRNLPGQGRIIWGGKIGGNALHTPDAEITYQVMVNVGVAGGTVITNEATVATSAKAWELTATTEVQYMAFLPLVAKGYPPPPAEITILHTNDFHANIKPDSSNRGGSAYIAGYANQVESEVGADNVVLLDAGDIMFGGTPYGPLTQGEALIDLYNRMGYAVATVGNHEFDKGQTLLETRVDQANFPFLAANVLVQGTNQQPPYLDPWTTVTVGGIKLGIIGLLTTETPDITVAGSTAGLEFQDPVTAVLRYYDEVKAASDAVILLTHEGVNDSGVNKGDKSVAQGLIAAGKPVDLIIGGHSHTDLKNTPVLVGNGVVTTTIVQAYYAGRQVGRVDATVNPVTKKLTVNKWEGHAITTTITADPDIAARVQYWDSTVGPLLRQPVGVSNVELIRNYNAESNMGDMVADSMRWKADLLDDGTVNGSVKIAFTNAGGLRADIVVPVGGSLPITITYGDTFNVLPFNNTLYTMDLTGDQIQSLLDQSAKLYKGILQSSGITHYWYNNCPPPCTTPTAWGAYGVKVGGELLVYTQTYRVVTNNFLATGGDSFTAFTKGTNRRDTGFDMQEGFNDWIRANSPLNNPADFGQRIVKLDKVVTILHTNDEHGRAPTETSRGLTRIAALVKAERAKNPNVLLLSTGDTIQGNSFAFYFRNAPGLTPSGTTTMTNPMMAAMNMMGYDAFAIGNHEYNFGNQTFVKALSQAEFSVLGANVADDGDYGLASVPVEDYVTFDVEGLKVAVLGLTNPRVPSYELPSNIPGLTFTGGFEAAQTLVPQIIANEDPDLLVSLEHLGYSPYEGSRPEDTDVYLADNLPGIDVIIGGHSHTKLDPAVLRTSITNTVGTLIAQAERYAGYLGKVTVGYTGNITDGYKIVFREGRLLPATLVSPDPGLEALMAPYVTELNTYTSQVIGESTVALDTRTAFYEETAGSNLQVDASKWALEQGGVAVDFHLSGAMTNASVPTGTLKVQDMFTLMPYENSLVVMRMNGPQIEAVLEKSFYNYDLWRQNKHRYTTCFLDISQGGVITYDTTVPETGDNVVSLTINGVPVDFTDASTYYNVSTVNYLAAGACSYSDAAGVSIWPLNQIVADTQYYVRDAVIDYIKTHTPVSPQVEGRIVFTP